MRKLLPYIGIALAVAIGIALAPYVLLILGAGLALAAIGGLAYAAWVQRRWVLMAGQIAFGLLLLWWPISLWRRGDRFNAVGLCVLAVLFIVWHAFIAGPVAAWWRRLTALEDEPVA